MLKKRPKKSFFWLLRGILGPNRHQKVFKRPITHLKTSQEFKFPIKNLPRWLLLPQKCKKWWYAIRAPCVRRPKTLKIKNFKKSSKNFLFFGVFQLNIHPLWGSKAQSWTSFKLNLMSARDPQWTGSIFLLRGVLWEHIEAKTKKIRRETAEKSPFSISKTI